MARTFNGAGDLHHRKVVRNTVECAEAAGAPSTEPVIFITGKLKTLPDESVHCIVTFNGAGDLHHRKVHEALAWKFLRIDLQRSR